MKNLFSLLMLLALTVPAIAQYNSKNLTVSEAQEDQYTFRNLRLYPIHANQEFRDAHKNVGRYLTLEKALEQKKVVITEAVANPSTGNNQRAQENNELAGGGETVNKLYAENVSTDTVMILTGEVVKGGKQDRMIAQDVLLVPGSGKIDISVFCVEHHRWNYQGGAGDGEEIKFTANKGNGSMKMRKIAAVEKNQSEVWKEVANVTTKNDAATGTGTFTALDTAKKYNEENKAYVEHFKKVIASQPEVIGVVVCTGDKVIGADMFATHELFIDHLDKLLQSYASEAITNGAKPTLSSSKAKAFLDDVFSNEEKQEEIVKQNGTVLKRGKTKLHMSKF